MVCVHLYRVVIIAHLENICILAELFKYDALFSYVEHFYIIKHVSKTNAECNHVFFSSRYQAIH